MGTSINRVGRGLGGADRDRTDDLLNAIQALSQLSYSPTRGARLYVASAGVSTNRAATEGYDRCTRAHDRCAGWSLPFRARQWWHRSAAKQPRRKRPREAVAPLFRVRH